MTDSNRPSIPPTYDHRETGDRFTVETRVEDRRVSLTPMPDPFMHHTVTIGWRDLLRGLLRRRLRVSVVVSGDHDIVEDVLELNADYTGEMGSERRAEWNAELQNALEEFARGL